MDPPQIEPGLVPGKNKISVLRYHRKGHLNCFFFFLVQSVVENFFADSLFDSRFFSSDLHSFPSTHSIETDPISFNLPSLKSGSIYRINQAVLTLTVELKKKRWF